MARSLRSLLAVAALALAAVFGGPALAQPTAPTDEEVRQALAYAEEAAEAFQAGDDQRAIVLFEQAFDLTPDPAFAFNLAALYDQTGNLPQAFDYYTAYLQLFPDAPNREDVEGIIDEIEYDLRQTFARVAITSDPDGSFVFLVATDDEGNPADFYLGTTPFERYFEPDTLTFRVEHIEHYDSEITVMPAVGVDAVEHVTLEHLPLPEVVEEETPDPRRDRERYTRNTTPGFVTVGAGTAVALSGLGVYLGSQSGTDEDPADGSGGGVGLALLGVGGAGIVVGAILAATAKPESFREEYQSVVAPWLTPDGAGVVWSGRF